MHASLRLLDKSDYFASWLETLLRLVGQQAVHPLLRGQAVRLLVDARHMAADDVERELSLALSQGEEAEHAADWLTGFLEGNTLILLHDEVLWHVVDSWLCGLSDDAFLYVLPLLRRIFADASQAERRSLGERAEQEAQAMPEQEPEAEGAAPVAGEDAASPAQAVPPVPGLISPLFRCILGLQEVAQ